MCNYLYHILKIIFIKVYILYVIQYAHLKAKNLVGSSCFLLSINVVNFRAS